jgi:hypothetical protein
VKGAAKQPEGCRQCLRSMISCKQRATAGTCGNIPEAKSAETWG